MKKRGDVEASGGESGYLEHGVEPVSGDFTQVEVLHRGEVTVLARAVRYGRRHLLKALSAEASAQLLYRQMLRKEFELLMRIDHPGVVRAVAMTAVEPLGECIVMEWIEGDTLDRWLEAHADRASARAAATQLLDAVQHIHHCGVVHRDLKPTNVMVTRTGRLKVVDFGLADTDAHVALKQPAGTAGYMAPEQLSTREADVRNDVYSLGAMLRQMNVGWWWQRVVDKCLRPIDERPQSVAALRDALRRVERGRRWAWRGAAVLLASALLVGGVLAVSNLRHDNARLQAEGDSLRVALAGIDSLQMQHSQTVAALADSLAQATAAGSALAKAQQERDARDRRVAEAIEDGKRAVDAAMRSTGIQAFIDTLRHQRYGSERYANANLESLEAINRYMDGLKPAFGTADRLIIYNALMDYRVAKWKPINEQWNSKPL